MAPSLPEHEAVHRYRSSVAWHGSTAAGYDDYDRDHPAVTDPPTVGLTVSADPAFRGNAAHLNPEQLLVTAAASCQLLSFLAVAARARLDVVGYEDTAEAEMPEDDRPVRITRITLAPRITVSVPGGAGSPDARATLEARITRLVGVAHRECYIANSLRSDILIQPPTVVIKDTSASG